MIEPMDAEERYCHEMLDHLRKCYEIEAKPYIDRIVAIKSRQPAPNITLTLDQARAIVDFTKKIDDQ